MCILGIKVKNCFLMISVFIILFSISIFADEESKIYINGIETDIISIGGENDAVVPFRPIAEMLGCEVLFDDSTGILKAKSGELDIEFTLNDKRAMVNGEKIDMDKEPYIKSGIAMVPVSFISDCLVKGYIDYKLNFFPGDENNSGIIEIFTPCPVWLDNKAGKVAAKIYYFYEELDKSLVSTKYAEYDVCIPYFIDMKTSDAAKNLNTNFENDFKAIRDVIKIELVKQKSTKNEVYYNVTDSRSFRIVNQYKNITSMLYMGYSYRGGAHGIPFMNGVNIDLENPYILPLRDLFIKDSDYKDVLLKKINEAIKQDTELYYVEEVSKLPSANSFYIEGENLVIYYNPYDIAPYAAGFVYFEIPLSDLSKILKDEYKP